MRFPNIGPTMDFLGLLPQEVVIDEIFPRLDFTTWARIPAVSRSWRRLSRTSAPPQTDLPWVWLSNRQLNYNDWLLNLRASTAHRLISAAVITGNIIGFGGQYLLVARNEVNDGTICKLYMCNPFTGHTLQLPPTPNWWKARDILIGRISPTPTPNNMEDCIVAVVADGLLHECRVGGGEWVEKSDPEVDPHDLIIYKGRLYFTPRPMPEIDVHNQLCSISTGTAPDLVLNIELEFGSSFTPYHYLVECCGELFVVTKYESKDRHRSFDERIQFCVHRVEPERRVLVKVDDLGDNMLFVGKGCCRSWSWPWPRRTFEFFTKNCVYFFYKKSWGTGLYVGKYCLRQKKMLKSSSSLLHHKVGLSYPLFPFWITANIPSRIN